MTGHPGIFAGGDMVPAERTVTVAIGHGKKAARSIDAWLRGTIHIMPPRHDLAAYSALNTWYYADAPATVRAQLDAARRITTFDEVTGGLDESTALFEARRCMSCGNCFGCDNCYGVCPDNAVIKLGTGSTRSTTTTAKAAASAPPNARAAPSRWNQSRPEPVGGDLFRIDCATCPDSGYMPRSMGTRDSPESGESQESAHVATSRDRQQRRAIGHHL